MASDPEAQPGQDEAQQGRQVSFLERALWKSLSDDASVTDYAKSWLGLQCRFITGAAGGVVVLGERPDEGPFSPAAFWPDEAILSPALSGAVEAALAEREALARPATETDNLLTVAVPCLIDQRVHGAVGLILDRRAVRDVAEVLRQLKWGAAWITSVVRREANVGQSGLVERLVSAFEVMAGALEQERFKTSCTAFVTDLALRLDCDQAAIGFLGGRKSVTVAALAHAAQFGRRMDLVRRIGTAMDEAIDQESAVLWPLGEDWEYRITHAHGDLAESFGGGTILTVPLHRAGEMLGAVTVQRPADRPFDDDTIRLLDALAGLMGPVLDEKRLNDRIILSKILDSLVAQGKRLLGPRYFGRKLATLIAAGMVAFFATVTGEYRVASPAILEGRIQRELVAPFDGFLTAQFVKAGEIVAQGQVLATLDDRDLVLERLRHDAQLRERLAEYDRALADDKPVDARILEAQIEESEAQIALVDAQLERTELKAPFDGLIISGDLSQSIGSGVRRGDLLFLVAPLESYRIVLEVDEGDIRELRKGQEGLLVVSALPEASMSYRIDRITPVSTAEEGRNFFRVQAELRGIDARLRPGMEGIAKTSIDERLLISIWSHGLVDWVRLFFWKWLP